jgi:hypothetical protein
MFGPGTVTNYMTNIFQIVLNGDGTGSAFYGIGDTINQPDSWQIGYMYCLRNTAIDLPYAQYQPFQFDSTAGQFVPSTTIDAQIRYAPTSSCTYMDAEWKNGAAGGFWYDRNLQFENSQSQPTTPGPAIPEYVVADPTDSTYPFNLFGDGSALQPQINSLGFVQPTWF